MHTYYSYRVTIARIFGCPGKVVSQNRLVFSQQRVTKKTSCEWYLLCCSTPNGNVINSKHLAKMKSHRTRETIGEQLFD